MRVLFISNECELLGIEYLSACLKKSGHSTSLVLDPKLFDTEIVFCKPLAALFSFKEIIIKKVNEANPDLICFSVCADNVRWAYALASAIKSIRDTPILFGGIHPTAVPEDVMKNPSVDYACIGEGEGAIVDLADALAQKKETASIPNIYSRQGGRVCANPPRPLIEKLDEIPLPDKDLYSTAYPQFMQGYKIITSRGCPYQCTYCASHQMSELYKNKGRWYRKRSVQNVIEELQRAVKKYPVKIVRFFDDVFTLDKEWLEEFSPIYKRKINVPYFCFIHPSNCDKDTIRLLEESGCATVFMGFGTYSEKNRIQVLRREYSNTTVEGVLRDFKASRIYVVVDMIFGVPGQTRDEVLQMARFFNKNRPDVLSVLFLRYYPKTDITRIAYKRGLLSETQISSLCRATFKERIFIEKALWRWLAKMQCLMLIGKYVPPSWVESCIKTGGYRLFPALDWNNLSVIIDSVFPKLHGRKRVHTDTISPLQFMHFYTVHIGYKLKYIVCACMDGLRKPYHGFVSVKKLLLIHRLGLRRMTPKKFLFTANYFIQTMIRKKDCPGAVIIGLTYKCQCKCVHCSVEYSSPEGKKQPQLDISQTKALLDQIADAGIPKVNFFGGEPLIMETELVPLVAHASQRGLSVSIDTNGILLTPSLLKRLKASGVNNINVSIDSSSHDTHDALRGFSGAFDKAVEALKLCVLERIPCVISTYASKRSIHSGDLQKIILLARQLKVTAVKILLPLMSGRWSKSTDELLTSAEKRAVYDLLEPGFVYLESPLFSMKDGKKRCEALSKKMVYVSPCGDVQLCYTVPFSFGNIRHESFRAILKRLWESDWFRSIDNNYDCVMNNPIFRERFMGTISGAQTLPISYKAMHV